MNLLCSNIPVTPAYGVYISQLEIPVPSQGHCGYLSFPVVDWFCLFVDLWALPFPLEDCLLFGNFVITLIDQGSHSFLSKKFQVFSRSFLNFFKVSLNIPNELRDSLNQSLNINWTEIAYYILSTLHVHVCLVEPLWLITVYLFIPTLILPLELFCVLSISRLLFFLCIDVSMNELRT